MKAVKVTFFNECSNLHKVSTLIAYTKEHKGGIDMYGYNILLDTKMMITVGLVVISLISAIIYLSDTQIYTRTTHSAAMKILEEKYENNEIDDHEFRTKKKMLNR